MQIETRKVDRPDGIFCLEIFEADPFVSMAMHQVYGSDVVAYLMGDGTIKPGPACPEGMRKMIESFPPVGQEAP